MNERMLLNERFNMAKEGNLSLIISSEIMLHLDAERYSSF